MEDWELPMQQVFPFHDTDVVQEKVKVLYNLATMSPQGLPG